MEFATYSVIFSLVVITILSGILLYLAWQRGQWIKEMKRRASIKEIRALRKLIIVKGPKGDRAVKALLDTGASNSFIRREVTLALADPIPLAHPVPVAFGQGEASIVEMFSCLLELDGYQMPWSFFVLPELTEELVLGADFFQRYKIKLDPEREDVIIDPQALRIQLI